MNPIIEGHRVILLLVALLVLASAPPGFCGEIHDAAKRGDLVKVAVLVKANPDLVSSKDNYGHTPLFLAAEQGHKDVVELLLSNKASVDAEDNSGETPLHLAASGGHKDVAARLLSNKAVPDARGYKGKTPLHLAATIRLA